MFKRSGLAAVLLVVALWASPMAAANSIDKFSVIAKTDTNTDVKVGESWRYDFGSSQVTKLDRVLFLGYRLDSKDYEVKVTDIQATDDRGNKLTVTSKLNGDQLTLSLLAPDQGSFTGQRIFHLTYRLEGAIRATATGARFNWRWLGGWKAKIINVDASLVMPGDYQDSQVNANCSYGPANRLGKCWLKKITSKDDLSVEMVNASQLYAGDIMETSVDFPSQNLQFPDWVALLRKKWKNYWPLALPVIFLLMAALGRGRWVQDPRKKEAFGARFYPPDDMTPMEVGYLMRGSFSRQDLAANIIALASRGFLDITLSTETGLTDYIIRLRRQPGAMANEHEQLIMNSLFANRSVVTMSVYLTELYQYLPVLEKALKQVIRDKGLDNRKARLMKEVLLVWWLLFSVAAWLGAKFFGLALINQIALSSCGLLMFLFSLWRPAFGKAWVETVYNIKGFERYLTSRELDSKFTANAPVRNQSMFEKYLAYAMVLGVERLWANQFDVAAILPPNWYQSPYHQVGQFNSYLLADELVTFSSVLAGQQLLR